MRRRFNPNRKPETETINHHRRPVGHITDLIRDLEKWLKVRENLPAKPYGRFTKLIHICIAYLIEYRDMVNEFPAPRVEIRPVRYVDVYDYEKKRTRRVYARRED